MTGTVRFYIKLFKRPRDGVSLGKPKIGKSPLSSKLNDLCFRSSKHWRVFTLRILEGNSLLVNCQLGWYRGNLLVPFWDEKVFLRSFSRRPVNDKG